MPPSTKGLPVFTGSGDTGTVGRLLKWMAAAEDVFLSLVLAAMVLLPLSEIVLRAGLSTGIEGVTGLVQHLTFAVASLGAAVAARDGRLLSFASVQFLEGRTAVWAKIVSNTVSVAVCVVLCNASIEFIQTEMTAGKILAHGLPVWIVELVQPVGFGLIAARLIRQASPTNIGRVVAALAAAVLLSFAMLLPVDPADLVVPGLIALAFATLLGAPVFVAIGGAALILLWGDDVPLASLAVDHYGLVVNPTLPTIPMFTLAGYFLAEGSSPKRLIELFHALFGQLRGGAAVVTVLACTFFTCFTGASGVTILALGGLVMPLLLASGYREKRALGLVTGAGSAGVLLIPALPLILYAIVAKISLEEMFLGGIVPAMLMIGLTVWWGMGKQSDPDARQGFDWRKAWQAMIGAKWELALPLIPIIGLFSGLATPVEAAALTAMYAFVVVTFVHRDLRLGTDVPRVMAQCGLLVGGILLILGVALGFTNYLVDAQLPDQIISWVTESISNKWTFLLALNLFLLVVGCVMDIFSAIVVLVPLVVPIGLAFGIHPVHLGIVFLANLELGYLTPPVGMNLFFSSYRFDTPVLDVYRAVVPLFLLLCLGVMLITYLPFLSTALPGLLTE